MSKKTKFIISLIVFIFALLIGVNYYYKTFYLKNKYLPPEVKEIIKENKENKQVEIPKATLQPEKYTNKLPEYRNKYNNKYIYGELIIPKVKIDTLITRANNNSYYLDHNLYNQYDVLGNPFFDYRNKTLSKSKQINIYGHNTENSKYYGQLPFTKLEAYTDKSTFEQAKDITLNIDEKSLKYKVIAVKIVNRNENEHTKILFSSPDDWITHTKRLLSNTLYIDNNEKDITTSDRLIVLQACHYNPRNSYTLVIGKEVQ